MRRGELEHDFVACLERSVLIITKIAFGLKGS